jgi:hypothetical protein
VRFQKVCAYRFCHLASHRKGGGGRGGDDPGWIFGVGRAIRLGEFQGGEIATCFVSARQLSGPCIAAAYPSINPSTRIRVRHTL